MIHNIKEDEEIVNDHKTHMMPLAGVINQGHLFQEMLPIHAQENPYMIQLLGQQKHIGIISNALKGWIARACSSLFFSPSYSTILFMLVCSYLLICVCIFSFACLFHMLLQFFNSIVKP
jgi:hypothetical protein